MVDSASGARLARRSWLIGIAAVPLMAGLPAAPAVAKARSKGVERVLSFHHQHTGETLEVVYQANGRYVRENLRRIDRLFRDWRTGQIKPIDPQLLDLLWDLRGKLDSSATIERTNAMLRRKSEGVAKNSFHLKGKAIDLKIAGRSCRQIRNAAVALRRGGVGYYPVSNFVHVDTGAPRTWAWG